MLSRRLLWLLIAVYCCGCNAYGQAARMFIYSGYARMSGGTSSTPIYLVSANSATNAITRSGSGYIISDGEFNRVQWNVRTTTGIFEFPLGKSGAYLPFKFNKTTAGVESGTGNVVVSSWYSLNNATPPAGTTACPDENSAVDRFWICNVNGYSTNPTADMYFYYDPAELDAIPEADLQAQRWNSAFAGTCKWELPPVGTPDVLNNFVLVTGVNNFSPWTLSNKNSPLPITLLYFTGACSEGKVELHWATASESNSAYFTLEKSNDGATFYEIVNVPAAGSSVFTNSYAFTDEEAAAGTHYYSLLETDRNGDKFSYGTIAVKDCETMRNTATIIDAWKVQDKYLLVKIIPERPFAYEALLFDMTGRAVYTAQGSANKGGNFSLIDCSAFAPGLYALRIVNPDVVFSRNFSIVRH